MACLVRQWKRWGGLQHQLVSLTAQSLQETCGGQGAVAGSALQLQQLRWASKKQGGSTQNNKGQNPQNLGIKMYGGQRCIPGNIIVRQRGTEFHPGANVGMGKDHTLFALIPGNIQFSFDKRRKRRMVAILPPETASASVSATA
ncbi:MRPL27 [Auxenochlorella protothecoides x Auxenochlorella symbiontica]